MYKYQGMCVCVVHNSCLSSGDMYEIGAEKGKFYSVNVPLRDGIDDQSESCDLLCDKHGMYSVRVYLCHISLYIHMSVSPIQAM